LVCIRPTRGLVSLDGIIPFVLSRDAIGPMAHTVEDAAIALSVLAEYDPNNPTLTTPIAPPPVELDKFYDDYTQFLDLNALNGSRIGIVSNYLGLENGVDPEITELVEDAIEVMEGLGATVVEVSFEDEFLSTMSRTYGAAIPVEQKVYLEEYLATLEVQYPQTLDELIAVLESPEIANSATPSSILGTLRRSAANGNLSDPAYLSDAVAQTPFVRNTLIGTLDSLNLDAFIFPTVNTFARSAFGTTDPTFISYPGSAPVRQVEFASSSGLPDITVPVGFGQLGLPATLSFTGRPYDESTLLGLAYSFEQATQFRRPSPLVPPLSGENLSIPESNPSIALVGLGVSLVGFRLIRSRKRRKGY
jgi:amidase